MHHSRQLAAIMFTDIVGYTALMGKDERRAFELLTKNRQIQIPIIEEFNGRFIKELGDGILASFPTASDSLFAAMKIQQACSASKELSLRIGIHEGETTFENNDIFGDAVNIASRIQTLGIPGSILFSKKITDEVKNKTEFQTVSLGSFEFRNVSEPIEVFALANEGLPVPKRSMMDGGKVDSKKRSKSRLLIAGALILTTIIFASLIYSIIVKPNFLREEIEKSIAVLPFRNDSPEDSTQYFMDGVMEELLNKLQSVKSLRVIGRTSAEQFRGQVKSISEIAKELGVNYIVEGSGQKSGNSLRMRVQLLAARNESHLWGNSFEQENLDMGEYFKAQSGFAEAIANELNAAMSPDEKKLIDKIDPISFAVYDKYLKSNQYWGDVGKESLQKALDFLNSAILEEPGWAPLYSGLAQVWMAVQQMGFEPPSVAIPKIYNYLDKALELDPNLPETHYLKAMIAHLVEWDWQKSEKEFLEALAVNPNDAHARALYGQLLCVLQRTNEGVTQGRLALSLDPLNPYVKCWYTAILLCVGDCKTAIDIAEEITVADPGNYLANNVILNAAFQCKEYDKVIKAERYNLPVFSVKEDDIKEIERIFKEQGFIKAYEKIMILLEKIAENNPISPLDMAIRYIMVNQPEKAMDWLEKGFELHDPVMTYIATKMFNLDPLFNNPRFIAIVKKMNLPVD